MQKQDAYKILFLMVVVIFFLSLKRNNNTQIGGGKKQKGGGTDEVILGGLGGAATGLVVGTAVGGVGAIPGGIIGGVVGAYSMYGCDLDCGTDVLDPEKCQCICKSPRQWHEGNKKCVECPNPRTKVGTLPGKDCVCKEGLKELCTTEYPVYETTTPEPGVDPSTINEPIITTSYRGTWNEDDCSCACSRNWGGPDCNKCACPEGSEYNLMIDAASDSTGVGDNKTCGSSNKCRCYCDRLPSDCQLTETDCGLHGHLPPDFHPSRMDAENCQCICDAGWDHSKQNGFCSKCVKPDSVCPTGQVVDPATCQCVKSGTDNGGNSYQSTGGEWICTPDKGCYMVNEIDRLVLKGSCSNHTTRNKCLRIESTGAYAGQPMSKYCDWDDTLNKCYSVCDNYKTAASCDASDACKWTKAAKYCLDTNPTDCQDVPAQCVKDKPEIIPGSGCGQYTDQASCCAKYATDWCDWYNGNCISIVNTPIGHQSVCLPDDW